MQYKYNYIRLMALVLTMFLPNIFQAQNVFVPDSIIVYTNDQKELIFDYNIKHGNTIYSISKAFQVGLQDLYQLNNGLNSKPLAVGENIVIPFNRDLLISDLKSLNKNSNKIFYLIGKKENLFRIAKIYFGISVDHLMKLNKLKDFNIQPGQLLFLGYVGEMDKASKILPEKKEITDNKKNGEPKGDKIVKVNDVENATEKEILKFEKFLNDEGVTVDSPKDSVEHEIIPVEIISDSGMALWNKNSHIKGIFVLNNDANLNTLMEIFNPLVNRKVFAKVIGRIPPNSYPDNVKVILSPETAISLGALDTRFFVRINYSK